MLADWLDVADQLIDGQFDEAGVVRSNRGDEVQSDLRRWADWLSVNRGVDAAMWVHLQPQGGPDA